MNKTNLTLSAVAAVAVAGAVIFTGFDRARSQRKAEFDALQRRADHYEELAKKVMVERDSWIDHLRGDKVKLKETIDEQRDQIAELERQLARDRG